MPKKPKPDNAEQSKEFIKVAKELDIDEDGYEFGRAIGIIAPALVPDNSKKITPPKRGRPPKEPAG